MTSPITIYALAFQFFAEKGDFLATSHKYKCYVDSDTVEISDSWTGKSARGVYYCEGAYPVRLNHSEYVRYRIDCVQQTFTAELSSYVSPKGEILSAWAGETINLDTSTALMKALEKLKCTTPTKH